MEQPNRIISLLELRLRNAVPEVDWYDPLLDNLNNDETREQYAVFVHSHKSKVVKKFLREIDEAKEEILRKYKQEIRYSKEDVFPRQWMLSDKRIANTLESYPMLCDLLNFLFNRTRFPNKNQIHVMQQLVGKQKFHAETGNLYEMSVFTTDPNFLQEASKSLKCSTRTIYRYIKNLSPAVVIIGHYGKHGYIHCDGYFTPLPNGSLVKHSLLKNTKKFKNFLRNFRPDRHQTQMDQN